MIAALLSKGRQSIDAAFFLPKCFALHPHFCCIHTSVAPLVCRRLGQQNNFALLPFFSLTTPPLSHAMSFFVFVSPPAVASGLQL